MPETKVARKLVRLTKSTSDGWSAKCIFGFVEKPQKKEQWFTSPNKSYIAADGRGVMSSFVIIVMVALLLVRITKILTPHW